MLVWWDRPGIGTVLFIVIVALIVVGFIEFLARGTIPETADDNVSVYNSPSLLGFRSPLGFL